MSDNQTYLRYKSFDSLLSDVMVDFKNYSLENLIEPQELIRVAKQCTKDLGLRIYKTKETLLELHHGKVKLPDDFYVFNYALLCGEGMVRIPKPQGTTVTEIPFPLAQDRTNNINECTDGTLCPTPNKPLCGGCMQCDICNPGLVIVPGYNPLQPYGDPCQKPRVFMDCKNNAFELIQIVNTETRHWKVMMPLRLINNTHEIACGCPNLYTQCTDHIWIKDGFLHSNMRHGKIYLNYQGALEDEDGNLLVLDHDIITVYYEYKLKHRIMENLWFNNEDVKQKVDYLEGKLKQARMEAKSIVNMPNFSELQTTWKLNRKAFNNRYVNMFVDFGWIRYGMNNLNTLMIDNGRFSR